MAILPIRLFGDPVLQRRADEVDHFDSELRDLTIDMIDTVKAENGVGLAGPQVGHCKRIFLVSDLNGQETFQVYINPVILEGSGIDHEEEGCLSLPDIRSKVERKASILLQAYDLSGKRLQLEATGLYARIFQHELDHLDGILFVQRIPRAKRFFLKSRLDQIRSDARKRLIHIEGDPK